MNEKKVARLRRARKTRAKIRQLRENRLVVNKTSRHMLAQIISPDGASVVAVASTVEKDFRGTVTGNKQAATKVGELIAKRAKKAGITKVAFDRSGYKYHGRVQALAEKAREVGLKF